MDNESPIKALLVVVLVAVICSALVSSTTVLLRPIQAGNQWLERGEIILQLTGLVEDSESLTDERMRRMFPLLDVRRVELASGDFVPGVTTADEETHVTVYLVWQDQKLDRIILPVSGEGMWSTIRGFIALESDLNTIAAVNFYEHAETPGLGDKIAHPGWLARWQGRRIYDETGVLRFAVADSVVDPVSEAAKYEVDALTGATVTADAVTALIHQWFGPSGYRPFLENLAEDPLAISSAGGF
jgi:Na+-transporting NADH:ubiquinone oxidoreductase subunit C